MNVSEIQSAKDKPMFIVNDYLLEVDKKADSKFYCRCIRQRQGTGSRCMQAEWQSQPEYRDLITRDACSETKRAVLAQPEKSLREAYSGVLAVSVNTLRDAHDDEEIGAAIPGFNSVRSILQRERAKVRPLLPQSREEINLDDQWTKTSTGANFLLFDDGSINRILGFSTNDLIISLCEASTVFMDGTFRVVPTIFSQLYTIHGFFRVQMAPFAYFLLPDKSKETYMRMFELLKNYAISIGRNFEPTTFRLHCEISTLRAIRESFPNSEVKGCLFHFNQCLWRKVLESGLVTFYKESEVKRFIRSTAALALVPRNRIEDAWLDINADSPSSEHPAHAKLED
ncbi:uncharacterized protein LOC108864374 [Galendromus occidentalis]|uniref:Uncharacterized protein LOC108864374 n=1 Tax=Galendromus occidentalis TaxID=34638 RepID=A0AAJ7PA00_9ACAR|nr:uncharacterized protein LOC108864374 [Galendromus occidentalis]